MSLWFLVKAVVLAFQMTRETGSNGLGESRIIVGFTLYSYSLKAFGYCLGAPRELRLDYDLKSGRAARQTDRPRLWA